MGTLSPREFVDKWRRAELKERSAVQEHFLDLCRLLGHPTPAEADPKGEWFTFEAGASKLGGGEGFADVWKKGFFAWEYKGKHANLDGAYRQLLQYREALENPPLLVVSDMDNIVIHTNFTNSVKRVESLALEDLLHPRGLELLRALFHEPGALQPRQTPGQVTEAAAARFAQLADRVRAYGEGHERVARFLIRLLFCLFAEDVGLLPKGLFTRLIQQTRHRSSALEAQLRDLFGKMAVGGWFGADEVLQFNGGLFDDAEALELDSEGMEILAQVSALDWGSMEPSILGTLFERSLNPDHRSQLGAHYTSKDDILLIVEPVLMAPLRRRWQEVREQARDLTARRAGAALGLRTRLHTELSRLIASFVAELAQVRVLDPACGSGNFLYVALRELLGLWKEVSQVASELGLPLLLPREGFSPHPGQLYGIEVNPYAHELAQATVWIGYIQWLQENGFGAPAEPILKPLHNIRRMDAILAYDDEGHPVEPEWPPADVIIGNPPFLGGNRIRRELGSEYVDGLFQLYVGRIPAFADLVCYWFEKARAQIEAGNAKRAGLLATQGIRGGANRKVLERIKETGDIFWAQADRNWIQDGVAVHVSMVGFDDGLETAHVLDGNPADQIHANLTSALDLTQARRLKENVGISFQGPSPKAPFDIDATTAADMLRAPINVNGRPNSDVVRPVLSAADLAQGSRGKWTLDFGLMPLEQAALYEAPFEYVKQYVLPMRAARRDDYRGQWWQYGRPRPEMREALTGMERYVATPRHAKHRTFVWVASVVLCNDATIVFARDDDYFLGVLHSRAHELWARRMGTQLREAESGFRYTPTTTFETFPFPWPPGKEPAGDARVEPIAQAARELVEKRDRWLDPEGASETELKRRTLTRLYNERPTWLDLAHRALDAAVFAAYGWPPDLADEEVLARLLSLNGERAGA